MNATPVTTQTTDTVLIPIYAGRPPLSPAAAGLTRRGRVVRDLVLGGAAMAGALFAGEITQVFAELALFVDAVLP